MSKFSFDPIEEKQLVNISLSCAEGEDGPTCQLGEYLPEVAKKFHDILNKHKDSPMDLKQMNRLIQTLNVANLGLQSLHSFDPANYTCGVCKKTFPAPENARSICDQCRIGTLPVK